MRTRWLHAITVAAAVTWAGTSACIRFGYDPVEPVPGADDAKPLPPPVDSGAGGLLDADASVPPEDAGILLPEDAGMLLPEDAGMLLPEDAGMLLPEDAGMLLPEDAGMLLPEDAGATLPDDAGTTEPSDGAPSRDCGTGVQLADACWYLGALGASCTQVCASHGGYVDEASYIGVTAEGGTLAHCDMLLDLLVGPGDTTSGMRSDGSAFGCHLYQGVRWWLNSGPTLDPLVHSLFAQLACSCNGP